jgi:hypothetical protein
MDEGIFGGQIPSELGMLTALGRLGLVNNSLTGTIPSELSNIQDALYTVDLRGNEGWTGTIAQTLCNINATCIPHSLNKCEGDGIGFQFDCTELLCGCHCPCENT